MIHTKSNILNNQRGLASIFVSMIMSIVIVLITIGFVQLTHHEQAQSLDKQLTTQAYYAAESGINEISDRFLNGGISSLTTKTSCTPAAPYVQQLDSTTYNANTSISCLYVDTSPTVLKYTIQSGQSKIIPLNTTSNIDTIKLSWNEYGQPQAYGSCPATYIQPDQSHYNGCGASTLHIDIFEAGSTTTPDPTAPSGSWLFLTPSHSGGNTASTSSSGLVPISCTDNNMCTVTISTSNTSKQDYIRILPIYNNTTSVKVMAYDSSHNKLGLSGAQAQIISTGKANNVVQSLQKNIDISTLNPYPPGFALQSQNNICADHQWDGVHAAFRSANDGSCSADEGL